MIKKILIIILFLSAAFCNVWAQEVLTYTTIISGNDYSGSTGESINIRAEYEGGGADVLSLVSGTSDTKEVYYNTKRVYNAAFALSAPHPLSSCTENSGTNSFYIYNEFKRTLTCNLTSMNPSPEEPVDLSYKMRGTVVCYANLKNEYIIPGDTYFSETSVPKLQTNKIVVDKGLVVQWQYTLDDPVAGPWSEVPTQTTHQLEVTPSDLFGFEVSKHYQKRVWFRVVISSSIGAYSDPQYLIIAPDVPDIDTEIKSIAPSCYGQKGSIELSFDREVQRTTEDIRVHWNDALVDKGDMVWITNEKLRVNNLLPKYDGGNSKLKIVGYYDNKDTGVNTIMTSQPVYTVKMANPLPVTFTNSSPTNPKCFGEKGSFTVTASGGAVSATKQYTLYYKKGTGGYTSVPFAASSTTHTLNNLESGTYSYHVKDENSCTPSADKTVIIAATPSKIAIAKVAAETKDPSGFDKANGQIKINISGGTPHSTSVKYIVSYQEGTNPVTTVNVSTVGASSTITGLKKGEYKVKATDAQGCSQELTITLAEPAKLEITELKQTVEILCNGQNTATLKATVVGGVGAYTYEWYKKDASNNYQRQSHLSGPQAPNLGKGDYRLIVKDSSNPKNETLPKDISITEPPKLIGISDPSKNITCYNANDGEISIKVEGGKLSYKLFYKKDGGARQVGGIYAPSTKKFTLSGLTAGYYVVDIEDTNGCKASIDGNTTLEVTLTAPTEIKPVLIKAQEPSGNGKSNGFIEYKVTGGTQNTSGDKYTVTWKNAANITFTPTNAFAGGVFTTKISGLPKGVYTLQIKDKNATSADNRCIETIVVNLNEPDLLTVALQNTGTIDCHAETTGELKANVLGGVQAPSAPFYTYQWYQMSGVTETPMSGENGAVISGLSTGRYKVKITDASSPANTVESTVFHITEPTLLVTTSSTGNISCHGGNDGFIHIGVSGGVQPYKLFRKLNGVETVYTEHPIDGSGNSFSLDNIVAGRYSIYVLDANNCYAQIGGEDIAEIELTQPDAISITVKDAKQPTGFGRSDGYISYQVTGGTPNLTDPLYDVVWKDEHGAPIVFTNTIEDGKFTTTIENLIKGTYTLEIRDQNDTGLSNGCFETTTLVLNEPSLLTVYLANTGTIVCHGATTGELVAHAQGGVIHVPGLPYTYNWYQVNEDLTETQIAGEHNGTISGLATGRYKVEILDASSPVNTIESAVFHIIEPTLLVTTPTKRDISCHAGNDGFIHIGIYGGAGGYRLFCKQEGVNPSHIEYPIDGGGSAFYLDNLVAGRYSVYIIDANNCFAQINGQDIFEFNIIEAAKPVEISSVTKTDASGFGRSDGSIVISIEGGTPNADGTYNVIWKNGDGQVQTATGKIEGGKYISTLGNVPKGQYIVEVKDKNFGIATISTNATCTISETYYLTQPDELLANIQETQVVSCNGMSDGQLIAHAVGGTRNPGLVGLPYKYKWYREINSVYTIIENEKDSVLSNQPSGIYKVVIEDYSRTANIVSVVYDLVQPDLLIATGTNTTIASGQKAIITVHMSGGTAPYAYQWSTGDITPTVADMDPGRYFVVVTDSRGCETTGIATVFTPGNLDVSGTTKNPVCYQSTDGSIDIEVIGGTAPHTYLWSNGATSKNLANVKAGNYTVKVTDKTGASFTQSFMLTEPAPIVVNLGDDRVLCRGQEVKLESLTAIPDAKTYAWVGSNGFKSSKKNVTVKEAGTYKLTVTDKKGCQGSDEVKITLKDIIISSEMLVASQVFVNDTVMIVNISDPQPDRLEWMFSDGELIEVLEMTDHFAKVIFTDLGQYTIGIRSHVKDCYQDNIKSITVIDAEDEGVDIFGESIINKFYVYPNPNSGIFNVELELNRESNIRLRIINIGTGTLINDQKFTGKKKYSIPYHLTLAPGAYAIILETASGRMNLKMFVK